MTDGYLRNYDSKQEPHQLKRIFVSDIGNFEDMQTTESERHPREISLLIVARESATSITAGTRTTRNADDQQEKPVVVTSNEVENTQLIKGTCHGGKRTVKDSWK